MAYRFYSRFIADRVFGLDPYRATPAERLANGRDFVLTSKWVLFGSPDPTLGFLAHARALEHSSVPNASRLIFNERLDAALAIFFMTVVCVIIVASAREWYLIASRRKMPRVNEAPYVESRLGDVVG